MQNYKVNKNNVKFTNDFKNKVIQLKNEGTYPNKIFIDNGYDIKEKQNDYTNKLIARWKKPKKEKKRISTNKHFS